MAARHGGLTGTSQHEISRLHVLIKENYTVLLLKFDVPIL
jgi:hypothetical protein